MFGIVFGFVFFFCKQKTAYEMRISDWSSDVCSSDLGPLRFFWAALVVIGLFFLLAQLAYVYRAQIANQVTFLRPVLERACQPLHCKVPYARKIDAISIMSSSLRAGPDAAANGESGKAAAAGSDSMVLQLTLRNTYDKQIVRTHVR